ncbi:MAG: hypothetical protein LBT12_01550 [Oscillospiraceae bacterium]|jgi:hypothetical protein|nr:hypothetical protein [Oscillospiraceae bacterium]
MRFDGLVNALLTVGVPVSHYTAHKQPDKYIVWAEDGQVNAEYADDEMLLQVIHGTLHYFTRLEYDPKFDEIQRALNRAGISWALDSIAFENTAGNNEQTPGTNYIHYTWDWAVENGEL